MLWRPSQKLSTVHGGFPDHVLHILVEHPTGESFSSTACAYTLIPSMRCRSRVVIVLSLTTPTLQRLADHPLPPHLSLADRLSLSNHSLIVQHRPRRRPYASWSSNDLRLPHHPILPILNSFRQRLPFRTLQQLPYHTILPTPTIQQSPRYTTHPQCLMKDLVKS